MSATMRCVCRRCVGEIAFTRVSDYLEAHAAAVELEACRAHHPSARVATFADGSQILVEANGDGNATVAVRPARWAVWGPPVELVEAD